MTSAKSHIPRDYIVSVQWPKPVTFSNCASVGHIAYFQAIGKLLWLIGQL